MAEENQSQTLVFYDIASDKPLRTFSPNPWKTRFALNYKKLPYRTEWVQMPHIRAVREKLGVPANRTLPDGTPFHTLPVIHDPANGGALVGDTFEIAEYLDRTYPDAPRLLRPHTTGLTAAFNARVDTLFTTYTILAAEMPFDPAYRDEIYAIFAGRFGAKSFEDMKLPEAQREPTWTAFEHALGELAKAYRHTGGTTDHFFRPSGTAAEQRQRAPPGREQGSVWLDGDGPAYADFIVGAWLKMMQASMAEKDFQRIRSWHDGLWGRLVDALEPYAEIK